MGALTLKRQSAVKTVTCLRQHPRRIATITSPPPPPPLLLAAAHCRPQKMIKWKLKLFFHDNSNFFPSLAMCVCVCVYVCCCVQCCNCRCLVTTNSSSSAFVRASSGLYINLKSRKNRVQQSRDTSQDDHDGARVRY